MHVEAISSSPSRVTVSKISRLSRSKHVGLSLATAVMAATSVLSAGQAVAQANSAYGLEEIVVTARRREESLQEVPVAITALDGEYLRSQNISSLEDMGIHVPSFRVTNTVNTNATIISLRGQRPSEVLLTLDPAVPLYFADVVLTPTQGTNLAMYDLQSVQVLKGPQGTLFGRNSTGGAVLLTPKAPGDEFGGHVEVKVGDYDLVQLEGAVDLPASDALKFRLAGRKVKRDGFQDNVADNELACRECFWDEDSYGLRLSMEFSPGERFSNLSIASFDKNDMAPRLTPIRAFNRAGEVPSLYQMIHNGGLAAALNPTLGILGLPLLPSDSSIDDAVASQQSWGRGGKKVGTDLDGRESVENTLFVNTTEFQISDRFSIKNILGYRKVEFFGALDTDGSAVPLISSITSPVDHVTYDPGGQQTDAEQWSQELQLMGSAFENKAEWIVGAYWMRMKGTSYQEAQVMGANPDWPMLSSSAIAPIFGPGVATIWALAQSGLPQISSDIDVVNEAKALFAEGTYSVNDQWTFTAGVRQTWDDREMTTRKRTFTGACQVVDGDDQLLPDNACSRRVQADFSSPTWRLSASYKPEENHMFFGSISTGYRAGGFNARGVDNFTLQPFDEETALNYEIGYKGDWSIGDMQFRSNLAIFLQEYNDIQKTQDHTVGSEFGTTIVNAAEAEIRGGELELTILPSNNLELSLAYSLVDTRYKKWVAPALVGFQPDGTPIIDNVDKSDADFTFIPKNSVTGYILYRLPLDPKLGDISLMASVYWQDKMTADENYPEWASSGWSDEDLANALAWAKLDSYTVWNVRMDWHGIWGSSFDLAIYSNNVTDKKYQLSARSVIEELGMIQSVEGAPRTIGAALRYRF